jgi:hypothetical protein
VAKNPKNPTNSSALSSSLQARFLTLQASFAGKGFFGKILSAILMAVALLGFALEMGFLLLSSLFSAVVSITGDKSTVRMAKAVRKNNFKSFKQVLNGALARDGVDNISRTLVSSIGGKLDVKLHEGLDTLTKRSVLKRYFKLLKIKDKSALELIKSSSCQKLLTQYDKTYGSVMNLEKTIAAAKVAKKANKKAAKRMRSVVLNVTSWSTTRNP